ncbi:sensor histidine kinase [Vulgatibacter sp.]|uniref:sensor histidine kinase n=1 Tax=Vulgatibacter sp. TaxID=1971226 RepID=UPI00356A852D
MLRTIGARLAAAYLLPSLLGLAALGYYVDALARRALEEELGRKVTAVAAAAAATMPADRIAFLRPGDEQTRTYRNVHERLEELRAATGVRRLLLFAPDERALVDAGGDAPIGAPLPELARDRFELTGVLAGEAQASQLLFEEGGALFKAGYAPVREGDRVVAAVLAEGSAASFAVLREFRASLLGLGLVAAIGVVAVAFLFSRTLVSPIRRLAAAARRIGGGDLATPVPHAATEELGSLAATLEEMREELLARDRQLQMMLAGIAHEVRNPLGGMELYSGLLLEELAGDAEKARQVQRIRREIEHLGRLVNEFLDYARERPLATEEVAAAALLEEAAALSAPEASTRGVTLEVQAAGASVHCDPAQVKRALLNLARNAVQASPPGSKVELRALPAGDRVRLEVVDRGAGVPAGSEARIFEPFFTTREKGTGLGLAFVRRIAEEHGGAVRHEPTPGGGATFVLELPAAASTAVRAHG